MPDVNYREKPRIHIFFGFIAFLVLMSFLGEILEAGIGVIGGLFGLMTAFAFLAIPVAAFAGIIYAVAKLFTAWKHTGDYRAYQNYDSHSSDTFADSQPSSDRLILPLILCVISLLLFIATVVIFLRPGTDFIKNLAKSPALYVILASAITGIFAVVLLLITYAYGRNKVTDR